MTKLFRTNSFLYLFYLLNKQADFRADDQLFVQKRFAGNIADIFILRNKRGFGNNGIAHFRQTEHLNFFNIGNKADHFGIALRIAEKALSQNG